METIIIGITNNQIAEDRYHSTIEFSFDQEVYDILEKTAEHVSGSVYDVIGSLVKRSVDEFIHGTK